MKLFGIDVREKFTVGALLVLLPLLFLAGLAIGGAVIWGITNVLSVAVTSASIPNLSYWESVLVYGALWMMARILDKS